MTHRRSCLAWGAAAACGLPVGAVAWAQAVANAAHGSGSGVAAESVRRFEGRATDATTGAWLYQEQHEHRYRQGRWWWGRIRYTDPQGQLVGEKTLDFSQDPTIPLSKTVFPLLAEEELVTRITPETVTMEVLRDGKRRNKTLARQTPMAVDSGFHALVQQEMDSLLAGKSLAFHLGVPNQLDTFRFKLTPTGVRTTESGRSVLALKAEPDSLLRMLVPTLQLLYDVRSREMLEYQGLSNILNPATRQAPQVRIVYTAPTA